MKYIDNHAHIHSCKKFYDLNDTIFVNVFDLDEEPMNFQYQSFGLHPNSVQKFTLDNVEKTIEKYIDRIIAIGETGIDCYYSKDFLDQQIAALELQDHLCSQHNKTLTIHARNYSIDLILKHIKTKRFFIHSFNYDIESLRKVLDQGGMVSFSGMLTFKNMEYLVDALKYCPKDSFLLETDSPFLLLRNVKIKHYSENNPYFVRYLYDFVSEILNINLSDLKIQLIKNFQSLYNLDKI